jgi:hypothetical protein
MEKTNSVWITSCSHVQPMKMHVPRKPGQKKTSEIENVGKL